MLQKSAAMSQPVQPPPMSEPPNNSANRVLAIETSQTAGSVALLENGQILAEKLLPPTERSAKTLAPAIDALLRETNWEPSSLNLIVVVRGPGSFTGLRIGVTTAKMLALALDCPLISVLTNDVLAEQILQASADKALQGATIKTAIEAHRQQLFAAEHRVDEGGKLQITRAVQLEELEAWLEALGEHSLATGPVLKRIASKLPSTAKVAPPEEWEPRAGIAGMLGWKDYCAGKREDPAQLVPFYIRPSYAEEKRT
jgi:tRNA threonylcarbamoyladenosine biosynthesis protein TsaB